MPLQPTRSVEEAAAGSVMVADCWRTSAPSRKADSVKGVAEGEKVRATWRQVESQAGRTTGSVTRRTRLLDESATAIAPLEGSAAIPNGLLKLAAAPVPSAKAPLPLPAIVVTTPAKVTSLRRLPSWSITTMLPLKGSTATLPG